MHIFLTLVGPNTKEHDKVTNKCYEEGTNPCTLGQKVCQCINADFLNLSIQIYIKNLVTFIQHQYVLTPVDV